MSHLLKFMTVIGSESMKNNKYCIIQKGEKYFLKFEKDSFEIEITKEQFQEIEDDIHFRLKAKNEGCAVCYPPIAERIRTECIKKKLEDTFKNVEKFGCAIKNVIKVYGDFVDNFCESMKILKPIIEQESQYVTFYYSDGYKELKPRKRSKSWNTRV